MATSKSGLEVFRVQVVERGYYPEFIGLCRPTPNNSEKNRR